MKEQVKNILDQIFVSANDERNNVRWDECIQWVDNIKHDISLCRMVLPAGIKNLKPPGGVLLYSHNAEYASISLFFGRNVICGYSHRFILYYSR